MVPENSCEQSVHHDSETRIDPREFRRALGHFATGVTVITAGTQAGDLIGITANSFNSVSLDPPMVLWSLDLSSKGLDLFLTAGHFCVNILSDEQVKISNHFATKQLDKFASVSHRLGEGGSPVLAECAANFQCRTAFTYEGGDHLIFVGEVVAFECSGKPGLVYHHGQYAVPEIHPFHTDKQLDGGEASGFVDDYLDYLLSLAAFRLQQRFQTKLDEAGRREFEWRVLAVLSDIPGACFDELKAKTLIAGPELHALLKSLEQQDLISGCSTKDAGCFLTRQGEREVLQLLAAAKAMEADALKNLTPASVRDLKHSLKKLNAFLSSTD